MKILLPKVLIIFLFVVILSSCKKEKSNTNIVHFEINRTLDINTYRIDTLNLDGVGTYDILFNVTTVGGQLVATIQTPNAASGIVEDTIYSVSTIYAKPFDKNVTINNLNRFTAGGEVNTIYNGAISLYRGSGNGDKYYGFKVKLADGIHYGWVLLNIDSDYLKLEIKQIAYNKVLNASIKTGEK
jgi:hypothetical protein